MFSSAFAFASGLRELHSGHWALDIYTFVRDMGLNSAQPETTDRI